ncbi:hypothetical protein [Acrocarpospora sp. B8E8]|uniref:hypothetical protein n=1 Tax=Acrocarpospora sp. B8E8 TaxID=3153572 RepID=UPI00325F2407
MTHDQIHEIGNAIQITDDQAEMLAEAANEVGRKFARQYPALEADDITHEVVAQAMAEWGHISTKMFKAADYGRSMFEVLHFLLSERASVYCGRQHYAYMMANATAIYTPREVRALLREYYFNPDAWTTPVKDTNHGVAVEANSIWVNLADLGQAMERITAKAHDTILAAYGPEDLELPEPDKRRVSEAVAQLTRELNRHLNKTNTNHEGPGARRAMSNEDALYITRKQGN